MAWAEKNSAGRWRGKYRDGQQKVRSVKGTFTSERLAKNAATVAEAESRELGWRDPKAAGRTWGEWREAWWPTRTVEASTRHRDLSRLEKHVTPKWDGTPLVEITRMRVKEWAQELAATPTGREDDYGEPVMLSPSSVLKIVSLLSGGLTAAVDEGILPANPAARLKLPPPAQAVERFLTHDEYLSVRAHLPTMFDQLIADFLVYTGVRFGELAGAHWDRVDAGSGVFRVVEVWDPVSQRVKPYTKAKKIRDVPVDAGLVTELAGLARGDRCGRSHTSGQCRSGLVFTGLRRHGPVNVNSWNTKIWSPAVADAGLSHCRVHDLRHTYASWLLQAGKTLAEVGALLGHESPTTTARYAHLARGAVHQSVLAALPSRTAATPVAKEPEVEFPRLRLVK